MPDYSEESPKISIFISYAHKDENMKDEVDKHLMALEREGLIETWHDRRILPGQEWAEEIDENLEYCCIILLLVSASFIASDYCYKIEMTKALDRHKNKEAKVIPIIIDHCDWPKLPFGELEALPKDVVPIIDWQPPSKGFTDAAKGIRKVVGVIKEQGLCAQIPKRRGKNIHWNMPHRENPNFTGRAGYLEKIGELLEANKATAITQAISGLGGVGKTQLALEYAYRNRDNYKIVWWVASETADALYSYYYKLAKKLGLPLNELMERDALISAVNHNLTERNDWLLIYDNVPEHKDIKKYLPKGGGHILITSRSPNFRSLGKVLEIKVLDRKDSIEFLLKRTGRVDKELSEKEKKGVDKVAKLLGDFPLALEQAGAYMERGIGFKEYAIMYEECKLKVLEEGEVQTDSYKETIATTWLMAFDELKKESPASIELLNIFAFYAPDEIPLRLLREGAEFLSEGLKTKISDKVAFNNVVFALSKYSLIDIREDKVSLHRLVQEVVIHGLSDDAKRTWLEMAVNLVNNLIPEDTSDVREWPKFTDVVAHGLRAIEHSFAGKYEFDKLGRLCNQLGSYQQAIADYAGAKVKYERALEIGVKAFGEEHPQVAIFSNNLGGVLESMGDYAGAKVKYERALEIDLKVFGEDHPDVAIDLNNLGIVLESMGDYAGAKEKYERALEIDLKALGEDHPNVAIRLSNLGGVLYAIGDYAGAKVKFVRALKILRAKLPEGHPTIKRVEDNLASLNASLK